MVRLAPGQHAQLGERPYVNLKELLMKRNTPQAARWPTRAQVDRASRRQLARWYGTLPTILSYEKARIFERIVNRMEAV